VWVVPVIKLVDWMQNPLPVSDPLHENILTVNTYTPEPESKAVTNVIGTAYVRTVDSYLPDVPDPSTLMMELVPADADVQLEIVIGSDWGTGFQANLVATNPTASEYAFWVGHIERGNTTYVEAPWNLNVKENPDGTLRVQSMGAAAEAIAPNADQQLLATFWMQGSSEEFKIRSSSVLIPKMVAPALSTTGDGRLRWTKTAPIFEVQKKSSLGDGPWETVETLYGVSEAEVPENAGTSFFRTCLAD
jgi:hypothetical protein